MSEQILVINAGSSSLKFHMYKVQPGDQLDFEFGGQVSGIGSSLPAFKVKDAQGQSMVKQDLDGEQAKAVTSAAGKPHPTTPCRQTKAANSRSSTILAS